MVPSPFRLFKHIFLNHFPIFRVYICFAFFKFLLLICTILQEFCSEPRLFRNGTDRFDINQGQAGTCWFLAVLASLAEYPHIIEQVCRLSVSHFVKLSKIKSTQQKSIECKDENS